MYELICEIGITQGCLWLPMLCNCFVTTRGTYFIFYLEIIGYYKELSAGIVTMIFSFMCAMIGSRLILSIVRENHFVKY